MNTVEEIRKLQLPDGQYIVVGGGCLAVRGIRDTKDLDILVTPSLFETLLGRGWPLDTIYEQKWHRQRFKRGDIEIYPDIFLEKTNSFVDVDSLIRHADIIEGIPFLQLESLRIFKMDSGREKDLRDVGLIDAFLKTDRPTRLKSLQKYTSKNP
jgi:hypothetical protein